MRDWSCEKTMADTHFGAEYETANLSERLSIPPGPQTYAEYRAAGRSGWPGTAMFLWSRHQNTKLGFIQPCKRM